MRDSNDTGIKANKKVTDWECVLRYLKAKGWLRVIPNTYALAIYRLGKAHERERQRHYEEFNR